MTEYVDMDLCTCGHPQDDHMADIPDANGFYFVSCAVCGCLEEYSQFDV